VYLYFFALSPNKIEVVRVEMKNVREGKLKGERREWERRKTKEERGGRRKETEEG